jgi:hypothetical protein
MTQYFCNSTMQFHHAFNILHHIACTLARQPCPAALPGSLAHGSLAWQPCPVALLGSLARQPCNNITSLEPAAGWTASFFTTVGRHAALHTFTGRNLVQVFPAIYKTLRVRTEMVFILGIITVPGFFFGIVTVPGFFLGIIGWSEASVALTTIFWSD